MKEPNGLWIWVDWLVERPNGDQLSGMDWPQQDRVKASGGVTHDLLQCINKLTHLTIACWTNGFSKEAHLALVMNWVGNINSPVIKWTPAITDITRHAAMHQTGTTLVLISREAYYYSNHWLKKLVATQTHYHAHLSSLICINYKSALTKWPCWVGHLILTEQIGPNRAE